MNRKWLISGITAALLVGGTAAYAAIPDSDDGEFHACVPNTGTLRTAFFFDKQATPNPCPSGYTEKVWNQTGPQGPVGPTGATGPTGPQGEPGSSSGGVNLVHIVGSTVTLTGPEGTIGTASAECPEGFIAMGGALNTVNSSSNISPEIRRAVLSNTVYSITMAGSSSTPSSFNVRVTCIEGTL